ncbi:hypothetical protein BGX38DRAFT_1141655 [Terfezia claveryi]|nr:hypothetical protein BGX38DRAFT_1141655 [Terfezia claveryi]
MPQRKRKDNPGKRDRVQPPLKTRVPVTGHPQPPHPQSARATIPTQPHQSPPPPKQATVAEYSSDDEESVGVSDTEVQPIASDESDTESNTEELSNTKDAPPALTLYREVSAMQPPPPTPTAHEPATESVYSEETARQISTDLMAITPFPGYGKEETSADSNKWKYYVYELTRLLAHSNGIVFNASFDLTLGHVTHGRITYEKEKERWTKAAQNAVDKEVERVVAMYKEQTTSPTPVTDTSTQTTPPTLAQKPTTNSVSTNTDHSPAKQVVKPKEKIAPPPEESQSSTPPPGSQKGKAPPETRSKGKGRLAPPPEITSPSSPKLAKTVQPPRSARSSDPPMRTGAVVFHAAPSKYKPGLMRRWIEEDNKGVQIVGIRWLLQEGRRVGKLASSLVIYLAHSIDSTRGLRMGKRIFRTTDYNWNI